MKKIVLALASTVLVTPMVFAQTKNFEGFTLGANIASTNTKFESTVANTDNTTTGLELQMQYGIALAPQWVLGVGATIGTAANKAGSVLNADLSTKGRSSLELTPGYVVSDSILVFGKLAALSATAEDGVGGSESISGVGYGLGVRGMVDKKIYWQVGYDTNTYGEKNLAGGNGTYKFKSTAFSLGVGYKF